MCSTSRKIPVKQIVSQSAPNGAFEAQTLLNENLIFTASPVGKETEATPLSVSLKSQSVLFTATTVATSSPMKEVMATPSSVCEQPLRSQRLDGATNTTGTAHPLEQAKEVVPPSLVKELQRKTAAAAATQGTQASCKSKSFLEGAATVVGPSQKKEEKTEKQLKHHTSATTGPTCKQPNETTPAAPYSNVTPVKAPLASATAQLSFTRSFVPPATGKATPLSMSVTDAGPVKSHLLLQDNTSPSSELPEKSTAPSISEESQNGILLQVAQFPEGAQQSTLSSNIAEGQHKSQNTPLQITNSSEQSAVKSSSTSREMVEGKHVTFRKQPSHLPKYQALLLSATETTKTQHVARGPIKCQTLPRKATVEPPQKENKEVCS
ncbi:hypothetical protein GBAR_LOCUS2641 [Geodia barretti]|uniref:Uncharacterized protein n=1 Tax=Geodia barretti TaxID=519541 RepID=A0AA35R0C0_GEOBA|nr:hypothetical protein GBAR_LOCUS2641 [Geodia barretti]